MQKRSYELLWALLAILVITGLYSAIVYANKSIPAAQGLFGHGLGVVGFLLMLMTETLYSLRKRSRRARWGRMSRWLQFHIFTGLVGPYMVLLHSAWKFNGLAGAVMLMTIIIVISGFIGRYIYTAVPRTADGVILQAREVEDQIQLIGAQIEQRSVGEPAAAQPMGQPIAVVPFGSSEPVDAPHARRAGTRAQAAELKRLTQQRAALERQLNSLASARKLMATWHSIHIPIGVALFTAAFIHAAGAIYYATLLK